MALKLGDIPLIANSLKYGTTQSIKLFNKVLGYSDFDRSLRKRMRNFNAFPSDFDIATHKKNILKDFSLPDFISVANLLHLDAVGDKNVLCDSIFNSLTNLNDFQNAIDSSFLSESENETNFQRESQIESSSDLDTNAMITASAQNSNLVSAVNSADTRTLDDVAGMANQFWFL